MSGSLVVLVTGAGQGVGAATARAFAAAGHRVVLAARSAGKLEALALELGPNALAAPCDVSDPASVDALYARVGEAHGRLDVLFNNAGLSLAAQEIDEMSFEDWRKVLSINVDGAFLAARGAFKMMKEQTPQGGRIINNGSVSAYAPRFNSAAYTTSKHAVTGLTKSIALDGRPYRIACGQIDIGNAASEMTQKMSKGVPQADGEIKAEPVMDVGHVAEAVVRMAELPLEANVLFQTIMATNMPFVGRG